MNRTARVRRGAAVVAATALGVTTLSLATPAGAATGPQNYTCTHDALGTPSAPFTLVVDTDTDAPVALKPGTSAAPTATSKVTIPDSLRGALYGLLNARSYQAAVGMDAKVDNQALTWSLSASGPIPASGDMVISASGPAGAINAPAQGPGEIAITAGNFLAQMTLTKADNSTTVVNIECTAPTPAPTVDKVAVSVPTTTTLSLNQANLAYGETAKASAKVDADAKGGFKPEGRVDFSFAGTTVSGDLNNGGQASIDIPVVPVGSYQVGAGFVPSTGQFEASSAAPAALTVVKDSTTAVVNAKYKAKKKKVKAKVQVTSQHGQIPTGTVKVKLKRKGKVVGKAKVKLNRFGKAKAVFGPVKRHGNYKVVAKYTGSANFTRTKGAVSFTV